MLKKRSLTMIIVVLLIFLSIAIFNGIQKNKAENQVSHLKEENKQLENEIDNLQSNAASDDQNENTFSEDIKWFTEEIYTVNNRKKLYDSIKASATDNLLDQLFGETPPKEDGTGHDVDRNIENLDVYGKYQDDDHYKALVKFNLKINGDEAEKIIQVNLEKVNDNWLVSKFDQFTESE